MAAIELSQVVSLPDLLLTNHFSLMVPNPPGGGDGNKLFVQNMSAVLPGQSNTVVALDLHRFKTHFAGKRQWGNEFVAEYVETSENAVFSAFKKWQDMQTHADTGLPMPKAGYTTQGVVTLYDADNNAAESRTFYGLFVKAIGNISVGETEGPVKVSVTFNYDYWKLGSF